jgi:Na+/H+ antiporter NhaC
MVTTLIDMQLPVHPEQIHILYPLIGAIFSGAVCGDHVSPFSETTIMAATSAGTYPIDHAQTQFPYALPAIIGSAVAFLVAGFLAPMGSFITVIASASTGILVTFALLLGANAYRKQTTKHL